MNRRTTTTVLFALALSLGLTPVGAEARGATIDKTGWWSRANTTVATPAAPVTVPPPPGIPEGDLVVGYAGGDEPSAILAVGIQPDEGPGATVERFTLRLREDPDAGGNVNTERAAIVACPITEFWAGGGNSPWDTRPAHDCAAASVEGERSSDGTWTFDLAPIGTVWFDTFGTIRPDGVVLEPLIGDSTTPFQAVFLGGDAIDVVLQAQPGPDDPGGGFDVPGDGAGTGGDGFSGGGGFSPPAGGGTDFEAPDPGSFETPPADTGDAGAPADQPADDGDAAAPPVAETPDAEPAASRAGDVFGNLPPLVVPGAIALLALLVITSYWLGPNGEPVATVRQRGVSRALDARARARKGS